jgi:hypothetical protein
MVSRRAGQANFRCAYLPDCLGFKALPAVAFARLEEAGVVRYPVKALSKEQAVFNISTDRVCTANKVFLGAEGESFGKVPCQRSPGLAGQLRCVQPLWMPFHMSCVSRRIIQTISSTI